MNRHGTKEARDILESLLGLGTPGAVQLEAVERLRALGENERPLIDGWRSFVPKVRTAVYEALLSRPKWTHSLLNALASNAIPASSLTAAQRQRLLKSRDKKIAALARGVVAEDAPRQRVRT
mgnify:CR=1 FL=1